MNSERIEQEIENGLIRKIKTGEMFDIPYGSRIDVSLELKKCYEKIDYSKVYEKITILLEEELAKKIVNKIVTEMGTDIKQLMYNQTIRDDFRFMLRKGVEEIMEKVK